MRCTHQRWEVVGTKAKIVRRQIKISQSSQLSDVGVGEIGKGIISDRKHRKLRWECHQVALKPDRAQVAQSE